MRCAGLLFLLSLLAACATGPSPQGQPPAPDAVKSMLLRLRADHLEGLGAGQTEAVTAKIADNLKSWGYPVAAGGKTPQPPTHILEAWVSKPERKSLPPGFSLTFGSEDERAPERQKTDVVTVGCTLAPAGGGAGKVSLSGEFSVAGAAKSIFSGLPDLGQEHFYVDRMGSVCLNLLSELKIAKEKPKEPAFAPAWIPDMRIEIKTKEGARKPGVSAPPPAVSAPAAAAPPAARPAENPTAPAAGQPETQPAPTAASAGGKASGNGEAQPEKPAITTEEKIDEADQRKQLIIHNQGTPIILEFGYDENRGMKW